MTIEQAIKDIKENVQPFAGGISLEMAIKALEEIEEYRVKEFQCHLAQQEGISIGYAKAIDELKQKFRAEFEEQMSLGLEDCINWADWLDVITEDMKAGAE